MSNIRRNVFPGLIIMSLGVIFLLKNLGLVEISVGALIKTYWPVILIYWGINQFFDRNGKVDFVSAFILLFLGVVFLGNNLDLFSINLSMFWNFFWPAIIILIGFTVIWGSRLKGKSHVAFMGGIEKKGHSWDLESSSYLALMGGVDLDLTKANIPEGETALELTAVMGGMDIYVPRDINLVCEGFAVLGGNGFPGKSSGGIVSSSKAHHVGTLGINKTVKITCKSIMGGIDVKLR